MTAEVQEAKRALASRMLDEDEDEDDDDAGKPPSAAAGAGGGFGYGLVNAEIRLVKYLVFAVTSADDDVQM